MMLNLFSIFDRISKAEHTPQVDTTPQEDVLSAEYLHRAYKAIHDAESQEIAERKASAVELKNGNQLGAKRHLQMAKLLENDRIQADVKIGEAIVVAITDKIRTMLPTPIEFPVAVFDNSLMSTLDSDCDEEPISVDVLRELEENAKAMEEREKTSFEMTPQPEIERLMEDE